MAQRHAGGDLSGKREPVVSSRVFMVRRAPIICLAIVVSLGALILSACAPPATGDSNTAVTQTASVTDFSSLRPPDKPNNWLVAPADFSGVATVDETAPVFDVPAPALAKAWRTVIESAPRTTVLAVSDDGLQIEAEQKSAVFGFTDRISVQVLGLDADRSTFVAYSVALVGYWDMGVNRGRLRDWIATLRKTVAAR